MTTFLTSTGARIILLPYDLDVGASHRHGIDVPTNKTIRVEKVSLLAISKAKDTGLLTLGVPKDVVGIVTVPDYRVSDPTDPTDPNTVEGVLGALVVSKIRALVVRDGTPLKGYLTSVTFHGSAEQFRLWAGNLISMGLEECTGIGKDIIHLIGGEPTFVDHIFSPTKDPELTVFENTLGKPVYLYLEEYNSDSKDPELKSTETKKSVNLEVISEAKPWSGVDQTIRDYLTNETKSQPAALDSLFVSEFFTPKEESAIDADEVIAKINQLGEKPTTLTLPPGQRYATLQQFEDHRDRNKRYDISVITDTERNVVLNHFSYIVGMRFWEASNKVKQEGMKLAVGRIEGHRATNFITTDLRRIAVKVKDPRPVNSERPSEQGIITEIIGLVIVTKKGLVE